MISGSSFGLGGGGDGKRMAWRNGQDAGGFWFWCDSRAFSFRRRNRIERREIFLYVRSVLLRRLLKMFLAARSPESLRQLAEIRSVYSCCMSATTGLAFLLRFAEVFLTIRIKPLTEVNRVQYVSLFYGF